MSPSADNPSWSATFSDPFSGGTLTISIDARRVNHIRTEHVLNGIEQPAWREFLGDQFCDLICLWTGLPGADMAVPEAFAQYLFAALEDPLRHPRLIEYTQFYDDGRPSHRTWEVVTRDGIIVIVRHADARSTISTAYIPESAVTGSANRRCVNAMVTRIEHYKAEILIEGRRFIVPPPLNQPFSSDKPLGSRVNLSFHLQKTWGFHAIDYEGETIVVWKKPLPPGPGRPLPPNPLKPKDRPES